MKEFQGLEEYAGDHPFCKGCKSPVCTHKGDTTNCPGKFVSIVSLVDGEKHVVEYECFLFSPNSHTYDYEAWYKGDQIVKLVEKWEKFGNRFAIFDESGKLLAEEKTGNFPWGK